MEWFLCTHIYVKKYFSWRRNSFDQNVFCRHVNSILYDEMQNEEFCKSLRTYSGPLVENDTMWYEKISTFTKSLLHDMFKEIWAQR